MRAGLLELPCSGVVPPRASRIGDGPSVEARRDGRIRRGRKLRGGAESTAVAAELNQLPAAGVALGVLWRDAALADLLRPRRISAVCLQDFWRPAQRRWLSKITPVSAAGSLAVCSRRNCGFREMGARVA